jgi:signal transduction histidine kinase
MMIQLKKDNIIIKFNISKDTPAIYGSFQEIQQVFLNLVQNARYALNEKYPGKDMDKILEVSCNKISISNNQYVRIIFHDHGIGIPENLLSKTITPFFTTKPLSEGTGLGLSISQRVVVNHGGKMVIESVQEEFTKIIIDLPVTK